MKCSNVVFLAMISSLVALCAKAGSYSTPMDDTIWQFDGSIFACSIAQPIPRFGSATFIYEAGLPLMLKVESQVLKKHVNTINIYSIPAPWHSLGTNIKHGNGPIQHQLYRYDSGATELLNKMNNGFWGRLDILADTKLRHRVTLSSIGLTDVIGQFSECLKHLLPVNFRQIQHTIIYYNSGKQQSHETINRTLHNITTYILADPHINRIDIDGHTDGIGESLNNLTLSMKRAEAIRKILIQRGISSTMITTRYHGDRYPARSNNTHEGRAKNRRVEIRLYKDNKQKIDKTTAVKSHIPK
ncbi:MAG: OmpA family protein [Endozoicomonadaceae bacterium]|nr:OmpA family protein [Endozoicomonadaceae bacterium]